MTIVGNYIDRALSAKTVNRGLTENALKCKYNGGGIPVGYVIDENQMFKIDNVNAPAVLEAFQKYADGATINDTRIQYVDLTKAPFAKHINRVVVISPNDLKQFHNPSN